MVAASLDDKGAWLVANVTRLGVLDLPRSISESKASGVASSQSIILLLTVSIDNRVEGIHTGLASVDVGVKDCRQQGCGSH
jgi:hypothetical protein